MIQGLSKPSKGVALLLALIVSALLTLGIYYFGGVLGAIQRHLWHEYEKERAAPVKPVHPGSVHVKFFTAPAKKTPAVDAH